MSNVSWSVCLCVGHTNILCKNGWTDRNAVWVLTYVGPMNRVLDVGSRSPTERDNFRGVQPIKKHSESVAVYGAKKRIQSLITARHALQPFVNILWPPVLMLVFCCSCSVFRLLVHICFCYVMFSSFSAILSDWLRRKCLKWPIFCVELDINPQLNQSVGHLFPNAPR